MNHQIATFYKKNYRKYVKKILWKLKKHGYQIEDAEDIVQEAFTKALTSPYEEKGRFVNWFDKIVDSVYWDWLRKEKHHNDFLEKENNEKIIEETEAPESKIEIKDIKNLMGKNPENYVLNLYYNEGISAKGIAKIENSSQTSIDRAIQNFKKEVKKM